MQKFIPSLFQPAKMAKHFYLFPVAVAFTVVKNSKAKLAQNNENRELYCHVPCAAVAE